jgi:hypothetical protein
LKGGKREKGERGQMRREPMLSTRLSVFAFSALSFSLSLRVDSQAMFPPRDAAADAAAADAADAEKCGDVAEIVRSQQRREKRRRTALQEVCVVRRS